MGEKTQEMPYEILYNYLYNKFIIYKIYDL